MKSAVRLVACVLLLSACNPADTFNAVPRSKVVATRFLDDFLVVPQEQIDAYFDEVFWEYMPRETWAKIVPNLLVELGPIESCELVNWRQSASASTSGSGTTVSLAYSCKHTKYDSRISLDLVMPFIGGAADDNASQTGEHEPKIQAFNINSLGLLIEQRIACMTTMPDRPGKVAFGVCLLTLLAALVVVVTRGGLIGWSALVLGAGLFLKIWFRPAKTDTRLALSLLLGSVALWLMTLGYVVSTWESGEVVELVVDTDPGEHTARLWVLDVDANPVVYYDAPPAVAASLLSAKPVQFTRAGETSERVPRANRVETLSEARTSQLLAAMGTKYKERNSAADIYYVLLGRARDRVALVVEIL